MGKLKAFPTNVGRPKYKHMEVKDHSANRKLIGGLLSDIRCVQHYISHRIRNL